MLVGVCFNCVLVISLIYIWIVSYDINIFILDFIIIFIGNDKINLVINFG